MTLVASSGAPRRALAADEKDSCLAAADQGQSLRDDGKYTEAREQFLSCSRNACPKLVHDQCADWLRQLDESIPTVVFGLKDDRGNEVTAVHVVADDKHLSGLVDGKPVPLDPGPHDIRFERDNPSQSVSVHVVLRAGEKNRDINAVFPPLEASPPETPPEPSPPPPATASSSPAAEAPPESPPPAPPSTGEARRVTSISLLAAGALGIGLGAYFGVKSQDEASIGDSTEKSLGRGGCGPDATPADARCKSLNDSRDAQNRDATLNVVFYSAGGALAAGAIATWFLWPKPAATKPSAAWVAPSFAPNGVGFCAGGVF